MHGKDHARVDEWAGRDWVRVPPALPLRLSWQAWHVLSCFAAATGPDADRLLVAVLVMPAGQ